MIPMGQPPGEQHCLRCSQAMEGAPVPPSFPEFFLHLAFLSPSPSAEAIRVHVENPIQCDVYLWFPRWVFAGELFIPQGKGDGNRNTMSDTTLNLIRKCFLPVTEKKNINPRLQFLADAKETSLMFSPFSAYHLWNTWGGRSCKHRYFLPHFPLVVPDRAQAHKSASGVSFCKWFSLGDTD